MKLYFELRIPIELSDTADAFLQRLPPDRVLSLNGKLVNPIPHYSNALELRTTVPTEARVIFVIECDQDMIRRNIITLQASLDPHAPEFGFIPLIGDTA